MLWTTSGSELQQLAFFPVRSMFGTVATLWLIAAQILKFHTLFQLEDGTVLICVISLVLVTHFRVAAFTRNVESLVVCVFIWNLLCKLASVWWSINLVIVICSLQACWTYFLFFILFRILLLIKFFRAPSLLLHNGSFCTTILLHLEEHVRAHLRSQNVCSAASFHPSRPLERGPEHRGGSLHHAGFSPRTGKSRGQFFPSIKWQECRKWP